MAILKIRDNDGNVTEVAALKGTGISKIEKTATNGLIDTYTITLTDGTTSTFTVTNGASGSADIVIDTALSNTSTNPVQNKAITTRVNALQGDLNNFIAEVPDLIRQRTLCVGLDERGEQVTHTIAQIYQHVQDGGQVILLHPTYPDTYFTLTDINESSAYFGGNMSDDNLILRFEYTDNGIYEYESSIATGPQLQEIDITQEQRWDSDTQGIARTNIGLDPILTIDASNNYRGINITDMTFTPADTEREYPRNGDGVGIYLSKDTVDLGYDHIQAEKLEFYGLRDDEQVILSNIAPGQESYDAATVGQLISQSQSWGSDTQLIALNNLGIGIGSATQPVAAKTLYLNPDGSELSRGISLMIDTDPETDNHSNVVEILSFYGQNGDEQVRLRNIAPGAETNDAATVGQIGHINGTLFINPEGLEVSGGISLIIEDEPETDDNSNVAEILSFYGQNGDEPVRLRNIAPGAAIGDAVNMSQLNAVSQSLGPQISTLSSGVHALASLFDDNLMQNGITEADEGKFLRVVNGKLTLVSIPNAEDGEF